MNSSGTGSSSSRHGTILFLAMALAFIGAVLIISLYDVLKERNFQTYRMVDERLADHLCQSLLEIFNFELQKALLNPDSAAIQKRIQTHPIPASREDILTWPEASLLQTDLNTAFQNYFENFAITERKMEISLTKKYLNLCDVRMVGQTAPVSWCDPGERIGTFSLQLHVSVNGVQKKLTANRSFQIVNQLPGPIGRFTLFVKNTDGEDYNLVANNSDGTPTSGVVPLVCYHGTWDSLEKNGWVFLGGSSPQILNISYGYVNTLFGEYFHFLSQNQQHVATTFSGVALPADAADFQLPLDTNTYLLDYLTDPLFVDLSFEEKFCGFFQSSPSGNMNFSNCLDSYFAAGGKTMNSSVLRLAGSVVHPKTNAEGRTPTYVLGDVNRLYARIRLLAFDSYPTDGVLGYVAFLKSPSDPSDTSAFWSQVNDAISLLGEIDPAKDQKVVESGTEHSLQNDFYLSGIEDLFVGISSYLKYASDLVNQGQGESYNLFLKTYFSENPQYLAKYGTNKGNNLTLSFNNCTAPRTGSFFSGDLAEIPADALRYKAVIGISPKEFSDRFLSNNTLHLQVPVEITDADGTGLFSLPAVTVADDASGIIFFENDLTLDELGPPPQNTATTLTFCSLKGNITLNSAQEYPANLLALNGTVLANQGLQIFGNLAVKTLPAASLRQGKRLEYNLLNNPETSTYEQFDSLFLSDQYHFFELASE